MNSKSSRGGRKRGLGAVQRIRQAHGVNVRQVTFLSTTTYSRSHSRAQINQHVVLALGQGCIARADCHCLPTLHLRPDLPGLPVLVGGVADCWIHARGVLHYSNMCVPGWNIFRLRLLAQYGLRGSLYGCWSLR